MANYKTYLSSTFSDLETYRDAIITLLNHFRETFLLNAMEIYIADGMYTLDKCLQDVAACDIYILLLANKYGSIAPDIDNSNSRHLSFTHLEYETARKLGKIIWVYIANEKTAPKDVLVQDEGDEKEYKQKMLNELKDDASRYSPIFFEHPIDLVQAVSASIIKKALTDPNVKNKYVDPNWKHCCDRNEQFLNYQQNRISQRSLFQLFVGSGYEEDIPGNLTNRCAIFSMHIPEEKIITFSFTDFYTNDSEDKNLYNFLFRLHDRVNPEAQIVKTSREELKSAIAEVYPFPCIVISMDNYVELTDEPKIKCIARIIKELNLLFAGDETFNKRMYFFYYLQDELDEPESMEKTRQHIQVLKDCLKGESLQAIYFNRFGPINRDHLEGWMDQYFTTDKFKIRKLYKESFQNLPPEFRMEIAEEKIRQLIERINNKDEQIISILNC